MTMLKMNEEIRIASFEKRKKSKKQKKGLSKKMINIIRTTQRNNIDLTAIADNKANVLLSLNAIIIAAIVPIILANLELISHYYLGIPLTILVATSFATVYFSAQVLKPSNFDEYRETISKSSKPSPFFFGYFYKRSAKDYFEYIDTALEESGDIKAHLAQDLYYIGKRLGEKLAMVRQAYNIFLIGIFTSIISTGILLLIF